MHYSNGNASQVLAQQGKMPVPTYYPNLTSVCNIIFISKRINIFSHQKKDKHIKNTVKRKSEKQCTSEPCSMRNVS